MGFGRWALIVAGVFLLGFGTSQLGISISRRTQDQVALQTVKLPDQAAATSSVSVREQETFPVARVIDGDTIELAGGRRVRYIGIDTPEVVDPRKPVACFGREAKEENARLVIGKTVRLEKDISETDTYGRLLRYVYLDDLMVNEYLVNQGFARSSTYPPDIKHQQRFLAAEQEARENKRGLWRGCQDASPTIGQEDGSTISPKKERVDSTACVIKGNISSSGEKIYHLPGCGSYDKTAIDQSRGEQWFCSEEEAVSTGWRKAKNCP